MVSVCLPSDALLQHLPSYLGFSYLGLGVSLHGCSSKTQPLLLTVDEGYLLTITLPDLQCGIAPPAPTQPRLWVTPLVTTPDLGRGVAPLSRSCAVSLVLSAAAPDLGCGVTPLGRRPWAWGPPGFCPWPRTWGGSFRPHYGAPVAAACATHRHRKQTYAYQKGKEWGQIRIWGLTAVCYYIENR